MSIFYKKKLFRAQKCSSASPPLESIQEYDPESPKPFEENLEEGEVDAEGDPAEVFSLPACYEAQAKASHLMLFTVNSLIDVVSTSCCLAAMESLHPKQVPRALYGW